MISYPAAVAAAAWTLFSLMALVGLVLLIACVNVANLMVARAERSHRETAIARALGATDARLWLQNLFEGGTITAIAVTLGLVLAFWMRGLLVQLIQGVLHVRAAVPPATLRSVVEAAVHRVDADVPVFNVRTIEQQLDRALLREQTFARLSTTFAVLALVLSAIGLYGVIGNAVSRRTREIGIRLALGAEPGWIVAMVVREAGVLIGTGIAVGLVSAIALGRALESLLFGVQPTDPLVAAGAVGLLTTVALVAAWVPARRAAHVDPLTALRVE